MYETRKTRRSETDRLADRFADNLSARRKRAEQVRRLVNDNDMSPDLAREIVDARLRRRIQRPWEGARRIDRDVDYKKAVRFHRQKLDEIAADRQGLKKFVAPVVQRVTVDEC